MAVTRRPAPAGHRASHRASAWPPALLRRFEAIAFNWGGTAVIERQADASDLRERIEKLCALGVDAAVISGTSVETVDRQLGARPVGPGRLYLCVNRGSEMYAVDEAGVHLLFRRQASKDELEALDAAAERTVTAMRATGLDVDPAVARFNCRRIDLIAGPDWLDPPKSQTTALLGAVQARMALAGTSLSAVATMASRESREAGMVDPRITTDAKHIEIGLTDKSDALAWLLQTWWQRGIGPGLLAIVGDEMGTLDGVRGSDNFMVVPAGARATVFSVGVEPEGVPDNVALVRGGPSVFLSFLDDQIARHHGHELPKIDRDPLWTIVINGAGHRLERVNQSLLTLASGTVSGSGAPCLRHPTVAPDVFVAGAYRGAGSDSELLPCPVWQELPVALGRGASLVRVLDMRTGMLWQTVPHSHGQIAAISLAALHQPGLVALAVQGPTPAAEPPLVLRAPRGGQPVREWTEGGIERLQVHGESAVVTAVVNERRFPSPAGPRVDRMAAFFTGTTNDQDLTLVHQEFDTVMRGHREAWSRRWLDVDIVIEGDDELQRSLRFALFHLIGQVADVGEAAVGARGLTGSAYRGHVFWDAEVFVLPFLAATHPPAARAMLEYRIRRLPRALEAARKLGRAGARFPWESAATGDDVTPTLARDHWGRGVPITTGTLEEHIVADIAWAASLYAEWSGDSEFWNGTGAMLIAETARYWASRIQTDADGRGHIVGVTGPDEYHESVNDNAFTNVMARWNLRRALQLADAGHFPLDHAERERWQQVADSVVDGYNPETHLYEQFSGFFGLEPLIIAEAAPRRPIAADLLFGHDRVAQAQIIKQADVLMLHHMVPGEVSAGSLAPNLVFYEPRTSHGSSLSPGVHAALLARAGRAEEAAAMLRLVSRIDLDDISGTTAGGLHLAAMGSLWQALVFGFAGLELSDDGISLDPHLPSQWNAVEIPIHLRGVAMRLRIEHGKMRLTAERDTAVVLPGGATAVATPHGTEVVQNDARWEVVQP